MARRQKKSRKSQQKVEELITVTFARDWEEAKNYETLLKTFDIPAMIKEQQESSVGAKGIAVMVPEEYLDEAHVVIESQDGYDDFYDLGLEDDNEMDFGDDFFEDDF